MTVLCVLELPDTLPDTSTSLHCDCNPLQTHSLRNASLEEGFKKVILVVVVFVCVLLISLFLSRSRAKGERGRASFPDSHRCPSKHILLVQVYRAPGTTANCTTSNTTSTSKRNTDTTITLLLLLTALLLHLALLLSKVLIILLLVLPQRRHY